MIFILVLIMCAVIVCLMYNACRCVELTEPMEIILARRISRLEQMRSKKELKVKELSFFKCKDNSESTTNKLKVLKLEIMLINNKIDKFSKFSSEL